MTLTRTFALAAGVALAAVTAASADQLADIKERGTLICGTMGNYEPFSFPNPQTRAIQGYEVDLCQAIADDLGVKLELKLIAVEARIPELTQGRVDVISAALGYSAERAQQIDYSNASFVSLQKLLVAKDGGFDSIDSLADKKISAPKGSSSERYVREVLPNASMLTFQDPPAAFLALAQGKVNAMILSEVASVKFINQTGDKFAFVSEPVAKEYWGLGLRKDEPAFKDAVNASLKKLEDSGKGAEIYDIWFGPETIYKMERPFKLDEPAGDPVLRPGA
ncbi:ABC transporter substrate-binding protein [uncultured Paracoccus sp.]|uniref:ABC transporter substrate-binding protein n=1 Tax=uncultured Paracoccus sp. TaxID=189685 RepID=UPI0025ECC066|nr:ABC transporter substrate-binding protein [uncultured Paracoccus sp.]